MFAVTCLYRKRIPSLRMRRNGDALGERIYIQLFRTLSCNSNKHVILFPGNHRHLDLKPTRIYKICKYRNLKNGTIYGILQYHEICLGLLTYLVFFRHQQILYQFTTQAQLLLSTHLSTTQTAPAHAVTAPPALPHVTYTYTLR